MAVTSVWAVKERVDNALNYVMNPEKTVEKPESNYLCYNL